jgi:hypothetical protein
MIYALYQRTHWSLQWQGMNLRAQPAFRYTTRAIGIEWSVNQVGRMPKRSGWWLAVGHGGAQENGVPALPCCAIEAAAQRADAADAGPKRSFAVPSLPLFYVARP